MYFYVCFGKDANRKQDLELAFSLRHACLKITFSLPIIL
jgi:hypothetical protein